VSNPILDFINEVILPKPATKEQSTEKHLQGKHDQATHGARGGAAGGAAPKGAADNAGNAGERLEFTSSWDKNLLKASDTAKAKGIKTFDSKMAETLSREAAGVINSHRKRGYTVYSAPVGDLTKKGDRTGYFPTVGYGAGESKAAVRRMRSMLEDFGYTTSLGPGDYGILVGHSSWK